MEVISQIEKESKMLEVESFDDYYFLPGNESLNPYEGPSPEICQLVRAASPTAQITTIVLSLFGVLFNICVIYVIIVLKEYKKSKIHWLFLHILIANVLFLSFVITQMGNELNGTWATGHGSCKMNQASAFSSMAAGVTILAVMNIYSLMSELKMDYFVIPKGFQWLKSEIFFAFLILLFIWLPCCLVNLPLYKNSTVNPCGHCSLDFPIEIEEICPMLGLNSSSCTELWSLFENDTETSFEMAYNASNVTDDVYVFSGEMFNNDMFELNFSEVAGMAACRYEEPRSFYMWLYTIFVLFYVAPLPFFAIFVGLQVYEFATAEKSASNQSSRKGSMKRAIFALDIIFFIFCTPWNVVRMRKAAYGIGSSAEGCVAVIIYSRLSAIAYNILVPCIYGIVTPHFRDRVVRSLMMSFNFCCHLFNQCTNKDLSGTSEKAAMTSASSSSDNDSGQEYSDATIIKETNISKDAKEFS